jgi:hypothetical protein
VFVRRQITLLNGLQELVAYAFQIGGAVGL